MSNQPEVWLRGPVEGVPWQLQPVAHALLQAVEDVDRLMEGWPDDLLWVRPGDAVASAGFHLQHLTGVVDRLFTYARGEQLNEAQREWLRAEGQPDSGTTSRQLVQRFHEQVGKALAQLRSTDPATLADARGVGRAQLPSTVIGLLFHAAEHCQRHVGQLLVTTRVLRAEAENG